MSDGDALERRLLPRKAKGSPDEFWLVASRRASLAEDDKGSEREKQHLAMAALFGSRGFRAGERDPARLTTYLAMFQRARAERCFPLQLQTVEARIRSELRLAAGESEPRIIAKKKKSVFTHVALYLVSDAKSFDGISADDSQWFDDAAKLSTVRSGRGVFIDTGADGFVRHEIRVVAGEIALQPREYAKLTSSADPVLLGVSSGLLRLGQPLAQPSECLEIKLEPGVYRVALYSLGDGDKCVVVATRTSLEDATNELPDAVGRYRQSIAGMLYTDGG